MSRYFSFIPSITILFLLGILQSNLKAQAVYGIGVQILMDNTLPTPLPYIQSVVAGSPAEKAGMKAGWHLYSVDRQLLSGKTIDQVINLIRGAEGTSVSIQVIIDAKANSKSYKTYKLYRAPIQQGGNPVTAPQQRFSDSTRQNFYLKCKDVSKRIVDQGFIIDYENVYDDCRSRYIKFIAEGGVDYRVRLLTLGKKGFTAKAVVWSDSDSNHPIQLSQSDYGDNMLMYETKLNMPQTTPCTILFDDNDKGTSECKAFYVMILK